MKLILDKYSKEQIKRIAPVKAIFFEAVGVFTDSKIIYDETGKDIARFSSRDGHIVKYLKRSGIHMGIISSGDSPVISRRCSELGLDFCHQAILDKASVFEKLLKHYKLKSKEVAFIGNDIDDIPVLKLAGFSVCAGDAPIYLQQKVTLITTARSGRGVFREVADLLLASRGELEKLTQ